MSVNSRLKVTKIIRQRRALLKQRIPESSCAKKETVDIDIMQFIGITSRSTSRKRKQNQLSQF